MFYADPMVKQKPGNQVEITTIIVKSVPVIKASVQ